MSVCARVRMCASMCERGLMFLLTCFHVNVGDAVGGGAGEGEGGRGSRGGGRVMNDCQVEANEDGDANSLPARMRCACSMKSYQDQPV